MNMVTRKPLGVLLCAILLFNIGVTNGADPIPESPNPLPGATQKIQILPNGKIEKAKKIPPRDVKTKETVKTKEKEDDTKKKATDKKKPVIKKIIKGVPKQIEKILGKKQPKKKAAGNKPKPIARIAGFKDWTTSVAFSPSGDLLAIGTYEKIRLWDPKTKKEVRTLKVQGGYLHALAFSEDGKTLYAGGYQSIFQFEVETGDLQRKLKGHRGYVTELEIIPGQQILVSSCDDLTVRIWDLSDNATSSPEIRKVQFSLPAYGISIHPNGTHVAVALGDKDLIIKQGQVVMIDLKTGETVKKFANHQRQTTDVQFSQDGKKLLSTSLDEKVNLHDVETGKATGFFGGHARPTNAILIVPDTPFVITGSGGRFKKKNEVKIWSHETGEDFVTIEAHRAQVTSIAFSPTTKFLAIGSYDKSVTVFDISKPLAASLAKIKKEKAEDAKKKTKSTDKESVKESV